MVSAIVGAGQVAPLTGGPPALIGRLASPEVADTVAISAAALSRQALDATVVDLQRLSATLARLDQLGTPAGPGEMLVLSEMAAEIAAAVQAIGAGFNDHPRLSPAPISVVEPDDGGSIASLLVRIRNPPPPASGPFSATPDAATNDASLWEACATAATMLLRTASDAIAAMRHRLHGSHPDAGLDGITAPPSAGPVADLARCEAQIAATMAWVEGPRPARPPGRIASAWRDWAASALRPVRALAAPGMALLQASVVFRVVLLCGGAIALWVATTLDLRLARIACAVIAGGLCIAGLWRALGTCLPRGLSIALDPARTPERPP